MEAASSGLSCGFRRGSGVPRDLGGLDDRRVSVVALETSATPPTPRMLNAED
jgi:hypothetical protein